MYEQVVQKRGQPLREGFTIVKVRAARLACMCSLFPMAGRWSGRSEIARDAHACARFSQWPDGGPAVRRSREMRMHVLAFPMAGRWSGRSEIARDAHACARFPNGPAVAACLIWQPTRTTGWPHGGWEKLPYLATNPNHRVTTRWLGEAALFGNQPEPPGDHTV